MLMLNKDTLQFEQNRVRICPVHNIAQLQRDIWSITVEMSNNIIQFKWYNLFVGIRYRIARSTQKRTSKNSTDGLIAKNKSLS